jgi:hypothetical protein
VNEWPNLENVDMNWSKIGIEGCMFISKAKWQNLSVLYIC